ncbi:hypothetical protein D4764_08G0011970 [Takifugu flavidus]|uniref:Uncharacterized protein n=1 Tax=Takifugu flavidus TaxID=433684 RepID=A0A5C6MUP3_9TELE|nr:hypothetical protein D4764_08G0011970 [Takifugu flavidus]
MTFTQTRNQLHRRLGPPPGGLRGGGAIGSSAQGRICCVLKPDSSTAESERH